MRKSTTFIAIAHQKNFEDYGCFYPFYLSSICFHSASLETSPLGNLSCILSLLLLYLWFLQSFNQNRQKIKEKKSFISKEMAFQYLILHAYSSLLSAPKLLSTVFRKQPVHESYVYCSWIEVPSASYIMLCVSEICLRTFMSSMEKKLLHSCVSLKKSQIKILLGGANCFIYVTVHIKSESEYLFLGHLYHFSCKELKIWYFYGYLYPFANLFYCNLD